MNVNRFETDVLIIGGGGAATAAAISAHEHGARTMLAVKGRFGVPGVRGAGATSNPLGDFWTMRTIGPHGSFLNPPELVYRDMLQTGLGMADPELCRVYVNEVSDAIKRLEQMGLKLKNKLFATMPANPNAGGTNGIVSTQKAILEGTATRVIEHANIVDLIIENGRCLGAVGVDDNGELLLIESAAVILAAGGVGQLFRYSFNPPGNTGDAYAMALRAGATLFNMEFMQQGLATTWPQQAMVMLYDMDKPYRLLNADGKAFLDDYLPDGVSAEQVSKLKASHWPVSCRDNALHIDRAIKGEVLAGRGTKHDAVLLDLSTAQRGFEPELFPAFMRSKGIDVKRDLLQVQVHHHTSNGGIRINQDAESTVPGLYAAGEAAGWQGADRLGGTMLSGSQVFGWRAGAKAAKTERASHRNGSCDSAIEALRCRASQFKEATGVQRPGELRRDLQQIMWETLLVEKDADTLTKAKHYIEDERGRLQTRIRIHEPADLALAFEHRNLIEVADVIIAAASMRTESRGSHFRRDFPTRNDTDWLTNIFVTSSHDQLVLRREWVAHEVGWKDQPGDVRIRPWG